MLRDADPKSFNAIYLVCGYTDMRFGIDSLAAIIEHRYKLSLFVQMSCSSSVADVPTKSKVCSGRATASCS
jgi:IS66 Orf2 like protein.